MCLSFLLPVKKTLLNLGIPLHFTGALLVFDPLKECILKPAGFYRCFCC